MQRNKVGLTTKQTIKVLSCTIAMTLGSMTLSHAATVPAGTQLADKQEIVRGNGAEPASLDVHKVESDVEFAIIHDFFDGLVYTDNKGNIEPRLAERWETKDNQTWVFHLRKGIQWSDGTPITAHDVVFSWRRLINPDTLSPYGSYLSNASVVNAKDIFAGKKKTEELGIKALDDFTLEVKLEKPVADLLQILTHQVMVPISEKALKKYGDKWTQPEIFVSSGAFKLSEWKVNERIVGVRNSYYWDDKNTVINKVTFLTIPAEKAETNRYLAGEIDITKTMPLDSFAQLKKTLGEQVRVSPKSSIYYYEINNQHPSFTDIRIRQALNLALDRDIIVDKVLGQGQIPAYDIMPPNTGGFDFKHADYASWTQEQRIAKAKELLNEAGFNQSNPLTFNLLYNTREMHKKLAITASSMWKKNLGVNAILQNQEWKVVLDNMHNGKFDLARGGWIGDYNSPMTFLRIFVSGNSNNTSQYANDKFDNLVKKASKTNDKEDYQQALDVITHDVPIIPIYYHVNTKLVKPYVGGFYVNPRGDFSTKDLYIIKH
ncbi:ABC transporter substrate-binding protein [Xenorhabdus hominickii]|uniref:Oligopeptide ABC transporter substrate-binding protein OppA n=1 Tax=Xenorhabdus hominickii TaxID=351679 RepID=A0A2G0Q8L2_XENHO|nr:ABC transporter substrate-binding protein [Xenorhabdus hominickii]AOM41192.1 oligopeptide ABC transporter substrate-binding protein OppA [Xenorhabdus hominickii]PHM55562.1 periplasmic murein peptide-binding protein precursor [Xenorhabdus hominickii]PHM57074.1 periplasmic murein peptide-binding protein precursor [Xenorhabdus hominickii]